MSFGREVYEVRRYFSYGHDHIRLFTDLHEAEEFVRRYEDVYGGPGQSDEAKIVTLTLSPEAPTVEIWHTATARRLDDKVDLAMHTGRRIYWSDEMTAPTEPYLEIVNGDYAIGWGRSPEEARKQVARKVEQWNKEIREVQDRKRTQALSSFLGATGPWMEGKM